MGAVRSSCSTPNCQTFLNFGIIECIVIDYHNTQYSSPCMTSLWVRSYGIRPSLAPLRNVRLFTHHALRAFYLYSSIYVQKVLGSAVAHTGRLPQSLLCPHRGILPFYPSLTNTTDALINKEEFEYRTHQLMLRLQVVMHSQPIYKSGVRGPTRTSYRVFPFATTESRCSSQCGRDHVHALIPP